MASICDPIHVNMYVISYICPIIKQDIAKPTLTLSPGATVEV